MSNRDQEAAEAVTCQFAGLTPEDCRRLVRGLHVMHRASEHRGPGSVEPARLDAQPPRSVAE
jgi:hypothetical protein